MSETPDSDVILLIISTTLLVGVLIRIWQEFGGAC